MELKVVKTGHEDQKLNILVYGESGTGKTSLIGSAEPRFKTLILDAESGLLSLRKRAAEITKQTGKKFEFDSYPIRSVDDLARARDFLYNGKHDYKLVALDSGTELQRQLSEAIRTKRKKEKDGTEVVTVNDTMETRDWGIILNKMVSVIRSFRDLPNVSFLMTALTQEEKNESTGESKIMPMLDGKIRQQIGGYFDHVLYSFSKERQLEDGGKRVEYRLLTQNNGRIMGKSRGGFLPLVCEPDFCKIYDSIFKDGAQ